MFSKESFEQKIAIIFDFQKTRKSIKEDDTFPIDLLCRNGKVIFFLLEIEKITCFAILVILIDSRKEKDRNFCLCSCYILSTFLSLHSCRQHDTSQRYNSDRLTYQDICVITCFYDRIIICKEC